jgi:hypothetical protein
MNENVQSTSQDHLGEPILANIGCFGRNRYRSYRKY